MSHDILKFSKVGLLLPSDEPYMLSLAEIKQAFGLSNHDRRNVFSGLSNGVINLFDAGVRRIIIGGSFISLKQRPADADIAWWYNADIDWSKVDPVFQSEEKRAARGKFLIDHKVDGVIDVPYRDTHECFLRQNLRMPTAYQSVGIILIKKESSA